jgi:soluble lytic murein transglycosylase-like protein
MPIPNVNQITTTLRGMPDQQLQQYAAMHKSDPYILSLAIQESNSRQQLRAGAMAKMAGQQPPTVADQDIAKMSQPVMPPQMPQGMPPQGMPPQMPQGAPIPQAPQAQQPQGIPALPAQNLQGMAEGGIAGYAGGGAGRGEGDAIDAYRQYAVAKARQMGLSPYLADSIFRIESGYNPNARSKTGPVGIGQLTKATGQAYGINPNERTDPYKNIDASIAYMSDLQKKYGGDSAKMAVAYNQGESVLNKHLRNNNGQINPSTLPTEAQGYLKKFSKLLTAAMPGSNAQAAELPSAAPAAQAAAPADQEKSSGRGLAALMGSLGIGGLGGLAAGTYEAFTPSFKPGSTFNQALNRTARTANPLGVLGMTGGALSAGAANALSNATPEQLEMLQNDIGSDTGVAAAIMNPANRGEDVTKAQMPYSEQMTNVAKTLVGHPDIYNRPSATAAVTPPEIPHEHGAYLPDDTTTAAAEPDTTGIAALTSPEAKKEEGGFNMSNEDMFNMGMALLAGKSQYAMQNLGEAGLTMGQMRAARNKQAAEVEAQRAMARYHNAYADIMPAKEQMFEARAQSLLGQVPPAQKFAAQNLLNLAKQEEAMASMASRNGEIGAAQQHTAKAAQYQQQVAGMISPSAGTMTAQAPAGVTTVPQAPDASAFKIVGTRPAG